MPKGLALNIHLGLFGKLSLIVQKTKVAPKIGRFAYRNLLLHQGTGCRDSMVLEIGKKYGSVA